MRTLLVLTEVLLQGMRDMLHDRGGKRKAETGVGIEATVPQRRGSWLSTARCLSLNTLSYD
jgi:hypothetical protein